VILQAILVLAMIGVLFTMPQYFQGVKGADAMGSGARLLPLIAGLVVGALPADRLTRLIGAKLTVALGFVLVAAGMALGATTSVSSSVAFVAAWMAVVGAGLGVTLATAASAALSELTEERSGVGSAVMQALQKVGGPFGTAILGSVLSSVYLAHLRLDGLPAPLESAARQSLFGSVSVATRLHSQTLLASARGAFVTGMDVSLVVAAGMAVAGLILALLFMPARSGAAKSPTSPSSVARADGELAESRSR
jgi:Na+/melibiose symporter-like transporter